ncbi:MAG: SCP2 sterol-binding domain-containing protein [Myxococcales bacterium]|nr:SCP2 sterol-binding domain-containing protein [Myxococcales bacterium]MCB9629646.1 SCP2 sterol-binding domain-containing protein [Sandaracinaceae bacterium]
MSTEPLQFLRDTAPTLFKKGIEALEGKASAGDARAIKTLEGIRSVTGAAFFVADGAGEVYLASKAGEISVSDSAPAGVPIKFAVGFPAEAAEMVLGEAASEGAIDDPRVAMGVAQIPNPDLDTMLAGKTLTCHLVIEDVPDLGNVTVRIGLNVPEPPATPGFTATLKFTDLEDLREGEINAQQLFMGGKLRMAGDYSVALQVAMGMMAKAQQR